MEQSNFEEYFSVVSISREADISLIAKYHHSSSIFYDSKRPNKRIFSIDVVLRWSMYRGKKTEIHADYNVEQICQELGLHASHVSNLLVMVNNICSLDFGGHYDFKETYIDKKRMNAHHEMFPSFLGYIQELAILKSAQEDDSSSSVKINSKGKGGFSLISKEERLLIVDILIQKRLQELKECSYDLLFEIGGIENWSSEVLRKYVKELKKMPTGEKAQRILARMVSLMILNYLKGEKLLMSKHENDVNMSQKQGVVIYTLLLVFNILNKSQAEKVRSAEDKAKYIHSLIDDKKNKRGLNIMQFEWEEISIENYLSGNQTPTVF